MFSASVMAKHSTCFGENLSVSSASVARRQVAERPARALTVHAAATRERASRTDRTAGQSVQQDAALSTSSGPAVEEPGRRSNGDAIRMRSLDVSNGGTRWWVDPSTGHPHTLWRTPDGATPRRLRETRNIPSVSNRAPRTPAAPSVSNQAPRAPATPRVSPSLITPQAPMASSAELTPPTPRQQIPLRKEQLPVQITAELERDAGSREFVMDSEFRWAQDDYNSMQRSIEIWAFIIQLRSRLFLMDQKWSYIGGFTEHKKAERMRLLAVWTRENVLQLGPTFIKLGQLASSREDLLAAPWIEELAKLQDRVPAFTSEKAISVVEQELGAPLQTLFCSFEKRPIAAASLGQVHRATLHSGEEVVVKVQRPGLRKLFDIDLANMQKLAGLLDRGDPARDFKGIYQECKTILYQEIDYINEGRNADRFRRNFRDTPWVKVPTVQWQQTSPSVITLEYLPGIKISDVPKLKQSGLDVAQIATRSTEAYIIQVLRHGFLHSDPHSGNLAVSTTGQLIWYDFGMMSEIAPAIKDRLMDMFYAVYRQDADAVIACLQDLGIIVPTGDVLPLKRAIGFFLENINRQAERQETLSAIGEDLFSLAVDQPFRFPASFTFVLRAFSTLEGIGKILVGSDYSFAKVAAPYAQELLDLQNARTFALSELGKQATEMSFAAAAMPGRVAKIEGVTRALEQGSLKLRVRDPASERAMRRSSIMQMATFQSVAVAGLLDVGTQLQLAGKSALSYPTFAGAIVLLGVIGWGFRRVRKLDKFEKDLKSGMNNFGQ